MIHALQNEKGLWLQDREQIGNHMAQYFRELFQSKNNRNFDMLNDLFQECVSLQENEVLCKILEPLEITSELWSIHNLKAPDPGGMLAVFYKKHWHIC